METHSQYEILSVNKCHFSKLIHNGCWDYVNRISARIALANFKIDCLKEKVLN